MLELAGTTLAAGFPCLAVQAYDDFEELHGRPEILPLPLPESPLLPRQIWCTKEWTGAWSPGGEKVGASWYGWRRSHFYRVRMWVTILSSGFNLFAVDLDWRFNGLSPLPDIYAFTNSRGQPIDVFAWWDGPHERALNVGLMWIRSSPASVSLVRRVQNRTFAGWEQGLFNEELSHRSQLVCCSENGMNGDWMNRSWKDHSHKWSKERQHARLRREGRPRCVADEATLPPAEGPPNTSRWIWMGPGPSGSRNELQQGWQPHIYNHVVRRYYGRCNGAVTDTCYYRTEAVGRKSPRVQALRTPRQISHFRAQRRNRTLRFSSAPSRCVACFWGECCD